MGVVLESWFWKVYAHFYDAVVQRFLPYRRLLAQVKEELSLGPNSGVLDLGCGTGNLLLRLAGNGDSGRLQGLDCSVPMLVRARRKLAAQEANLDWDLVQGDLTHPLPWGTGSFDAVAMVNVLYAVPNPEHVFRECYRVLRPGGRLLVVTPAPKPSLSALARAHLEELRLQYPHTWRRELFWQIAATSWALPVFFLANIMIQRRSGYIFPENQQLLQWARTAGFRENQINLVYADQAWLLLGRVPGGQPASEEEMMP